MTDTRRKSILGVEELESRSLPSGFFSPAVQADLAKIQADAHKLASDAVALAPVLQRDQQAIQAAVAASPTVQAAEARLAADLNFWGAVLKADGQAFAAAPDPATRSAVLNKFFQDVAGATRTFQTDNAAIVAAVNSDAAVQAAVQHLQADAAPLATDQAVLQADFVQLKKDFQG